MNGNLICCYLIDNVGFPDFDTIKRVLDDANSNIIIFADGLNEVSDPDLRQRIVSDISMIRQKFNTQFCISSRNEHTGLFLTYSNDSSFGKAFVKELSDEQIIQYLVKVECDVSFDSIDYKTRKLLRTPQGLSMYCDLYKHDKRNEDIDSLGRLIITYAEMIVGSKIHNYPEQSDYLKKIAYQMTIDEKFEYDYNRMIEVIGKNITDTYNDNNPLSAIFSVDKKGKYFFTHQNMRDAFCALEFAGLVESIETDITSISDVFKRNNITTNDEILELASSFISDDTIQITIDAIRESKTSESFPKCFKDNYDFPLNVLIRIWAFSHDECIAGLDLFDLNLTQVSLNNYMLKSTDDIIGISNCVLGLDTFLKPGLPTASSAICKYTIKENGVEKLFLAAFDKKSVLIHDVKENQTSMVYSSVDYGWTNCCCYVEQHEKNNIYLGCENDAIVRYDIVSKEKELFKETERQTSDGIQSIVTVVWNGQTYLVCSDSDGMIFVYDIETGETKCQYDLSAKYKQKKEMIKGCRMSCHDKTVYIIYGAYILGLCLENNDEKGNDILVCYNYNNAFTHSIKDICVTSKFIFLNQINRVAVLSKKDQTLVWEYLIKDESPQTDNYLVYAGGCEEKPNNFFFTRITPIPHRYYGSEEGILLGVKTTDGKIYKDLPEFIEIRINRTDKFVTSPHVLEVRTEQKLATHTGVYFKVPSSVGKDSIRIATTSDDRSVDIVAPHNEEIAPIHIAGAYNGVHFIQILDSNNMICAQYDGTVIHLCQTDDKWMVSHIKKPHTDWVWKVQCLNYKENEKMEIISCSYDQTLKITDILSYSPSYVLCRSKEKMLDFYISPDKQAIHAVSETEVHRISFMNDRWTSESVDLRKMIPGISIRCVVNLNNDRPYFFYNTGSDADYKSSSDTKGFIGYIANKTEIANIIECDPGVFIRKMDFDSVTDRLIIAGDKKLSDDEKPAYIACYSINLEKNSSESAEPKWFYLLDNDKSDSIRAPLKTL